jgi:hypothetical protein
MDKGYTDYSLYAYWTAEKVFFVTRLKDNATYEVIEKREVPVNRNILSDELIKFTGYKARKDCPIPLRRIAVWDAEGSFQNSVSWVRPPKVSPQLSGSGSQALRMGTIKTARRKGLASAGAGFAKTIFFSGNKYISDF